MKFRLFSLLILIGPFGFTQSSTDLDQVVAKSLRFIENNQNSTESSIYWKGEWPVQMRSYFLLPLLGVGKLWAQPVDEPTAFATASIANLLSETYLAERKYFQIPQMLDKAMKSTDHYKQGDLYNYYNLINWHGVQVRGPKSSHYVPKYIEGLTTVPADADTTSATYMAKAYYQHISEGLRLSQYKLPAEVLETFDRYRDVNRTSHYYNWLDSITATGAVMTWFVDENTMPKGIFKKPPAGPRIPFGFNDVDCVVNANVLRLLAATKNNSHPAFQKSCDLLNFVILKEKQAQCGIYYPNSYAVFFSISNSYKAGATCLKDSKEKALDFIVSSQNEDGSWLNEPGIGRTDTVQSTALALNALMNYTEMDSLHYSTQIRRGVDFLLKQLKQKNNEEIYWPGEVFFSAVAQARNTVLWRSDSYTTSLVTLALVKSQKYLGAGL